MNHGALSEIPTMISVVGHDYELITTALTVNISNKTRALSTISDSS